MGGRRELEPFIYPWSLNLREFDPSLLLKSSRFMSREEYVIHPDDRHAFDRQLRDVLAGHVSVEEFRIITKGATRWLENRAVPVYPYWVYGVCVDITPYKNLEHSAPYGGSAATAASQSPDYLFIVSGQGRILYTSPLIADWVNDDWPCVLEKNLIRNVDPTDRDEVRSRLNDLLQSDEPKKSVLQFKNMHGIRIGVELAIIPVENGLDANKYTLLFIYSNSDPGKHLRVAMSERNVNTAELARLTGVSQATISNLKTGKVAKPQIETARLVAQALGVTIRHLWPTLRY